MIVSIGTSDPTSKAKEMTFLTSGMSVAELGIPPAQFGCSLRQKSRLLYKKVSHEEGGFCQHRQHE